MCNFCEYEDSNNQDSDHLLDVLKEKLGEQHATPRSEEDDTHLIEVLYILDKGAEYVSYVVEGDVWEARRYTQDLVNSFMRFHRETYSSEVEYTLLSAVDGLLVLL